MALYAYPPPPPAATICWEDGSCRTVLPSPAAAKHLKAVLLKSGLAVSIKIRRGHLRTVTYCWKGAMCDE